MGRIFKRRGSQEGEEEEEEEEDQEEEEEERRTEKAGGKDCNKRACRDGRNSINLSVKQTGEQQRGVGSQNKDSELTAKESVK